MLVVFCNLLEKTIDYLTRTHDSYCFKERKVLLVMDNYVVNSSLFMYHQICLINDQTSLHVERCKEFFKGM